MTDMTQTSALRGFARLCGDGFRLGFHERNGGNLTYRMSEADVSECRPYFTEPREWREMGVSGANLAGEFFITTGTGKFFSNVPLDPAANVGIVEINDKGDAWRIVWGLEGGGAPTSEFPSHFLNHSVKKAATNGAHRVIYHGHPANLIALTFVLPLTDESFTRELWEMMPECSVVFPAGVGVLTWGVPGSREIALATCEKMKTYDTVVWAHHGLFCSGAAFDDAFGLMHTIEKAAEILVKILSMGGKKQTTTRQNFADLDKAYKLNLDARFIQ